MPIVKKRIKEAVEQYKGVMLRSTLYKVYASALERRLKVELQEKKIILYNQAGFRKGMRTVNNIYVSNYVVVDSWKREEESWWCYL